MKITCKKKILLAKNRNGKILNNLAQLGKNFQTNDLFR